MAEQGDDRPFRRRVLRNSVAVGASNVWAILVVLGSLPLMLHGLGATQFGIWVLLQVFSASTGWLGILDAGLGTSATRSLAAAASVADHERVGTVLGTTLSLFGVLSGIGAVVTALVTWPLLALILHVPIHLSGQLHAATYVLALQVAAELLLQGVQSSLDGFQRVDLSRGTEMCRRAFFSFGAALAAVASHRILTVEVTATAGTLAALVIGAALLWWQARHLSLKIAGPEAGALIRYGAIVAPLRPIASLFALMDRVIVGAVLGAAAVAIVEVATQIANGVLALSGSLSYALLPGAAWIESRGDTATLRRAYVDGTRYTLLVAWPLVVGSAIFAPAGIALWVGHRYEAAATPTVVALAEVGLTMAAQVASVILLGIGKASVILRVSLIGVLVDLGLSLWLVHPLGVVGVFWGTVAGSAFIVPALLIALDRHVALPVGSVLRAAMLPLVVPVALEVLVCAVVANLGLAPLPTLALGVPLGGGVFALAAWRWSLHRGELRDLWTSMRSRPDA